MTVWPLPTMNRRVVGLSLLTARAFLCFPCGGAPSVLSTSAQGGLRLAPLTFLPVSTTCLTSEDTSRAAWLVAEQLLQGCPKITPPSTSPPVSTPSIRGRLMSLARGSSRSPEPSASGCPALRTFRPRGLSPPRRLAPPSACRLVASRCRSWGSLGFCVTRLPTASHASPPAPYPPELIRLQSRIPVTRDRYLPAVPRMRPPRLGVPADFKVLLRASVRGEASSLPIGCARGSHGLPAPEASWLHTVVAATLRDSFRRCRRHCRDRSSITRLFSATPDGLPLFRPGPRTVSLNPCQ